MFGDKHSTFPLPFKKIVEVFSYIINRILGGKEIVGVSVKNGNQNDWIRKWPKPEMAETKIPPNIALNWNLKARSNLCWICSVSAKWTKMGGGGGGGGVSVKNGNWKDQIRKWPKPEMAETGND